MVAQKKKVSRKYLDQREVGWLLKSLVKSGQANTEDLSTDDTAKIVRGFKISKRTKLALIRTVRRIHAHVNGLSLWSSERLREMVDQAVLDLPTTMRGRVRVTRNAPRPKKLTSPKKKKINPIRKKKIGSKKKRTGSEYSRSPENLANLEKARATRKKLAKKIRKAGGIPSVDEARQAIANLRSEGGSSDRLTALEAKVGVIFEALGL